MAEIRTSSSAQYDPTTSAQYDLSKTTYTGVNPNYYVSTYNQPGSLYLYNYSNFASRFTPISQAGGVLFDFGDNIGSVDIATGGFGDVMISGAGADELFGFGGDDRLDGGANADDLYGGDGIDTAVYARSTAGVTVDLTLTGPQDSAGDAQGDRLSDIENLVGSAFADSLTGTDGDNVLEGGAGADTLIGGGGFDTASYAGSGVAVTVDLKLTGSQTSGGDAQGDVLSGIETLIGSAFADRLTGDAGSNLLNGGAGNDTLDGGDGNDTLRGGAGADRLIGGAGIDTADYSSDANGVTVNLSGRVQSGGDAQGDVLSSIENLIGGAYADRLTGDARSNLLDGGAGNDTLDGGAGNDTLHGGAGADTLIGGAGIDTADYGSDFDGVSVDLSGSVQSGGEAQGDTLSSIENVLGGFGSDVLTGSDVANALSGGAGVDTLYGLAGNDRLDGGGDADSMIGGDGNDIYFVDNVGDTVTEATGTAGGSDTVTISAASWTLGAGQAVEFLRATSVDGITLTGNELNQSIFGGDGSDTLAGGGGTDRLYGGQGDDTYIVDNATTVVSENADSGYDTVNASVSHRLGANVENLTLAGTGDLTGTGNDLGNFINGNDGANVLSGAAGDDWLYGAGGNDRLDGGDGQDRLDGGTGADRLTGGAGDDSYLVDDAGDTVIELAGGGIDTVESSISYALRGHVENLSLSGDATLSGTGNELANVLTGNDGANTLKGGAGNDTLIGGYGADTLYGGSNGPFDPPDQDTFLFWSASDSTREMRDTIRDFDAVHDHIALQFDANADTWETEDFTFVSGAFKVGDAGQLHAVRAGGNTLIEADVDGDAVADFQLVLVGVNADSITRDNFIFSGQLDA